MANEVNIGAIEVTMGLDNSKLGPAANETKKKLKEVEDAGSKMASAIVSKVAGLVAAFATVNGAIAIFQKSLADARMLSQLSATTGITVEQLTALRFATEQSGVEFTTLTTIIGQFNQRMIEMARDVNSLGQTTFRELGINIRDTSGNLRTFENLLPQVADKFAQYADGANKTAVATTLFGEAGARLIPFLNKGAAGIEELKQEAQRLGIVLNTEGIAKTEEFNRKWSAFSEQARAAAQSVTELMLPALRKLVDWIQRATIGIRDFFKDWNASTKVAKLDDLRSQIQEVTRAQTEASRTAAHYKGVLDDLMKAGWSDTHAAAIEHTQVQWATAMKAADNYRKTLDALQAQIYDLERGIPRVAVDLPQQSQMLDPTKFNEQLRIMREEFALFMDNFSGEKPWIGPDGWNAILNVEGFKDAHAELIKAQAQGVVTAQQAMRTKLQLHRQEQQAIMDTAQLLGSTLTTVFNKSKTAAIAQATINTMVGVTKALATVPWPLNWIQAALVAASGAAQVSQIRSTSESGGGSVSVGGGASAGGADAGASAGLDQTLFVQGFNPREWYSGDRVADLADQLLEYQRNGGQVVIERTA